MSISDLKPFYLCEDCKITQIEAVLYAWEFKDDRFIMLCDLDFFFRTVLKNNGMVT